MIGEKIKDDKYIFTTKFLTSSPKGEEARIDQRYACALSWDLCCDVPVESSIKFEIKIKNNFLSLSKKFWLYILIFK